MCEGASAGVPCAQVQLALLQDGDVLAAGGQDSSFQEYASAEVFDVKGRQWTSVGDMSSPRTLHQVLL